MKKNIISLIFIITFIIFILLTSTYSTFALGDIFSGAETFEKVGANTYGTEGTIVSGLITTDSLKKASNSIYNILLTVGVVAAVIIGIVIGIQFITGSAEEKAKVKETLIPYISGCIIVFGAFIIWKIVVTVLQST